MSKEKCILINPETGENIPLRSVEVTGNIDGLTCQWTIVQKFENREDKAIEAVFSFPLPSDSTLNSLKIITGKRTIIAKPEEREEAFEKYDEAIKKGNGAFLLDQERPDFFVMSLGNLLPKQQVEIRISLFQPLQAQSDGARISFPVAIVPKYSPSPNSAAAMEWERVQPGFTDKAPYGFNLILNIKQNSSIKTIESPSHPIRIQYEQSSAIVSLSQNNSVPDADIVISFELVENFKPMLSSAKFNDKEHVLFEVFPDFSSTSESQQAKEVTFIVDCSGSMSGDSIKEAKNALQLCIRSLNEGDHFQIVCFGSTYQALFEKPLTFNQDSLEKASKAIANIDADLGGTEILPALTAAIKALKLEFSNLILFTDGAVSNEAEVIKLARAKKNRCRIFSFGIGNGVSENLVKGIAEKTGGKAEFIYPGERIEPKVLRQFNRLNAPRLSNVKISWNMEDIESVPEKISAVFSGEVIRFAARLKEGKKISKKLLVKLEADLEGQHLTWESDKLVKASNDVPALYWAKQMILECENQADEQSSGSKQRERNKTKTISPMVEISESYGIICSKTSYIGIEEREADEKNDGKVELRKIPAMNPAHRSFMSGQVQLPRTFGSIGADVMLNCCAPPPCPSPQAKRAMPPRGAKFESRSIILAEESCDSYDSEGIVDKAFSQPEPLTERSRSGHDSEEDILMQILMLVKADGSFEYSEKLLQLLKTSSKDFSTWLSKAPGKLKENEKKSYAITLLVQEKLKTTFISQKEIWATIANKIERWLKKF